MTTVKDSLPAMVSTQQGGEMKKLLSIDDEPLMLQCLYHALKSHGYELITTNDPDEGIRIVRENPDIVLALLDVRMPRKNGFDTYNEIRAIRKIPVLFVTAYPKSFTPQSDDVVQMWENEFADGTTDIIYKPFDLDSLYEKVEGLIGTSSELGDTE